MAVTKVEREERRKADKAKRSSEKRGPGARPRSQMERQRPDLGVASPARCLRPFRCSEPRYACASDRPFVQRNGRCGAFAHHPGATQLDLVNFRFGAHNGLKSDIARCPKCANS